MIVELLIFNQNAKVDAPTIDDLAFLTEDLRINTSHETIEFVIRIISKSKNILNLINRSSNETRSSSYIIISDQLISQKTTDNKYTHTSLLIDNKSRLKHTKSFCGLIGIFPNDLPNPDDIDEIGIDEYATFQHNDIQILRDKLENVVHRVWLKSPVTYINHHNLSRVNSIKISSVFSKQELYDCLKLRNQVYKSLGYISEKKSHGLETDFYDPVSFHFRAIDTENGNNTVGTMRLIVPGFRILHNHTNVVLPDALWFKGISKKANSISLPVFQSFEFFRSPNTKIIPKDPAIRANKVCEISRVIVSPEYQGMGISRLLMHHAMTVAKQLKREYIWLECAPHHIEMYKKFGFTVKDHGNGYFYERLQQFDTWAVAMYLAIQTTSNAPVNNNESSATCYYLPITKGRAKNCTLRFQYFNKPVDKIRKIFEQPLFNKDSNTPLKELIPSTLIHLNIEQFISCLKQVFDDIEPNKLSFIHHSGRNHVFNTVDIKTGNRSEIETHLYQWLG